MRKEQVLIEFKQWLKSYDLFSAHFTAVITECVQVFIEDAGRLYSVYDVDQLCDEHLMDYKRYLEDFPYGLEEYEDLVKLPLSLFVQWLKNK